MAKARSLSGQLFLSSPAQVEHEEKVLHYIIHRIDQGADLREVLRAMYRRVAEESPHGQGSIAMLERLLSFWPSKLMVLALLGFIATDFMITITLSASDAAVHFAENPLVPAVFRDQELLITLLLVAVLGGVFLKGFREAARHPTATSAGRRVTPSCIWSATSS